MWRAGATICLVVAAVLVIRCPALSQQPAAADEQICDLRADAALGLEDYPTAVKLHQYLLRSHPNDALAHYHLGFAYGMIGRGAEEIDEYQKAVTLGLHHWDLFLNLGLAYVARGELAAAAKALEQAAVRAPERPETHFNLALVYEAEHRLSEALKEITIARRLSRYDQDIENTRAILCAEIGDLRCARKVWTHLVQAGYSPARANLAILARITSPGPGLSPLFEQSPLVTQRQHAMGSSREN